MLRVIQGRFTADAMLGTVREEDPQAERGAFGGLLLGPSAVVGLVLGRR